VDELLLSWLDELSLGPAFRYQQMDWWLGWCGSGPAVVAVAWAGWVGALVLAFGGLPRSSG